MDQLTDTTGDSLISAPGGAVYNDCTTNTTPSFTFNVTQSADWSNEITFVPGTSGTPDQADLSVTLPSTPTAGATLTGTGLAALCTITVGGTVNATPVTGTAPIQVNTITFDDAGGLTIASASSACSLAGVSQGDGATYTATYDLDQTVTVGP